VRAGAGSSSDQPFLETSFLEQPGGITTGTVPSVLPASPVLSWAEQMAPPVEAVLGAPVMFVTIVARAIASAGSGVVAPTSALLALTLLSAVDRRRRLMPPTLAPSR
jgi:hypothetical protein